MDYLLKKLSHYHDHITGRHTWARWRHKLPSFPEGGNNGRPNVIARLKRLLTVLVWVFFFLSQCQAKADTKKAKKEQTQGPAEMNSTFHGSERLRRRYFWLQLFAGTALLIGHKLKS